MNKVIKIDNLNSPALKPYTITSEVELLRYNEPDYGLFIAESAKVISRALQAGYEPVNMLVQEDQISAENKELIESFDMAPVYSASSELLKQIKGFNLTRGILCQMRRRQPLKLEEVLNTSNKIAILENIENPTNVGAIVRSAAAMGFDGIVFTDGCANPLYRRAIRVSMGTIFQIPWTFISGDKYIDTINAAGFTTLAMALKEDSLSIAHKSLKNLHRLAIILGNEGDGLSSYTLENTSHTIIIPMHHNVDSLNVAAAASIAFWQFGDGS